MTDNKPLINRVANSGLINFNLETHYPKHEFEIFDLKDYLYMELILKEKDFRAALKEVDWSKTESKILLLTCSTDAIIPVWAYMLISAYASDYAHEIFQGDKTEYLKHHYQKFIDSIDAKKYDGARVVIKGCSEKPVPPSAYALITAKLKPYAQSIMYGEPCSTVPIFKRPRVLKKA
ncbi:DUF2480 family protein [Portibacter marinus]|uniref:DUF2480 family protein n=1 Tax=Portibacter marinus TaxID=2898660 RepID=UPI001F1735EF|nr:DUF2480 family protein [Portibacter marinus]